MIIRGSRQLKSRYSRLQPGDVFVGRLPESALKQSFLVDLLEKGVHCLPSALSQVLNHSKAAQAFILANWMIPDTCVIARRADLIQAMNRYEQKSIDWVVTKDEQKHCGHGIRRWRSVEMVYNTIGLSKDTYPFVLQPYLGTVTDIRVIIVDNYVEAYVRRNPTNFRQNIAIGGHSEPFKLDAATIGLCRAVMERGKFPYAHIDLLVDEKNTVYLSEIALEGGIKGAQINRQNLAEKKQSVLEKSAKKKHSTVNAG